MSLKPINTARVRLVLGVVLISIGGVCKMKVKKVTKTSKQLPVYDLTVPKYHNFSINGGIIVHNSIDCVRYALDKYASRKGN